MFAIGQYGDFPAWVFLAMALYAVVGAARQAREREFGVNFWAATIFGALFLLKFTVSIF